jgi:cytoskeleton protein RodZ
MILRANADSWVQVREKGGKILLNRILRPGETWPVPDDAAAPLLLTTGNAGGTELLVGGKLAPSLGNAGAVRRDLPLDPERAMAGTLAPTPVTAH